MKGSITQGFDLLFNSKDHGKGTLAIIIPQFHFRSQTKVQLYVFNNSLSRVLLIAIITVTVADRVAHLILVARWETSSESSRGAEAG